MLVFDGGCGFCTASARWVEHRLPSGSVEPWQLIDLRAVGLSPTDVADYAWWVDPDGSRRRGHRAIAASLRAIGGGWGVVGRVLAVPPVSWLAAGVYHVVAANRHRLHRFGTTPACANGRC
jgi:predicted DCC family thiol-disulfide oxidoreductase YuxK